MSLHRRLAILVVAAACGQDKKTPDASTPRDAPVDATPVDAPPDAQAFVLAVTCPATPNADVAVAVTGDAFVPPSVTVPLDGVVRFTMPASHSVRPRGTQTDPGLVVGFSEVKCLRFTKAGTLDFECNPHLFPGVVIVTP